MWHSNRTKSLNHTSETQKAFFQFRIFRSVYTCSLYLLQTLVANLTKFPYTLLIICYLYLTLDLNYKVSMGAVAFGPAINFQKIFCASIWNSLLKLFICIIISFLLNIGQNIYFTDKFVFIKSCIL